MRASTVIMLVLALVFGSAAVFFARAWIERQADARLRAIDANVKTVEATTIVVASQPMRFGAELTRAQLKEIPWPAEALPAGAFAKIGELTDQKDKRVVLASIETNEPVLAAKLTGPGHRATLSAVIEEGMTAVTVRVDDILGVGGFVLPGDRVDIALTRPMGATEHVTDILLQNIRVLAIDQQADDRTDKPSVVKAVTVEVQPIEAQKIALATSVGTLSLSLRRAGEVEAYATRRVTTADLGLANLAHTMEPKPVEPAAAAAVAAEPAKATPTKAAPAPAPAVVIDQRATVGVIRAAKREEYAVPKEAFN